MRGLILSGFTFIIVYLLVYGYFAHADEVPWTVRETTQDLYTPAPKGLTGYTIHNANGKDTRVLAEDYMLVPRHRKYKTVEKERERVIAPAPVAVVKPTYTKNTISLLVGEGPRDGLDTTRTGNEVTVDNRVGATAGLQYQYHFTPHWSVPIQGQTNKTGLIGIGYSW